MRHCCITGTLHTGTPKGEIKDINNICTYTVSPSTTPKAALILMTDIFGSTFANTQLLADAFAACGYLVLIADVFDGRSLPLSTYKLTSTPPCRSPRRWIRFTEAVIRWVREEKGVQRVGGVGYCFGGRYVCRWLGKGDREGLNAGFIAHPSFVSVEEVWGVRAPLSIAAAETDDIFPAEKRRETEDMLKQLSVPYQMCLYSHVEHGFGVKGDLSHARANFAKKMAFQQAVCWMDEFVKKDWREEDRRSELAVR